MTVKVGIIGYGTSGAFFHAPMIDAVDGLQLTSIASSRVDAIKHDYPDVNVTTTDDLLSQPDIDLIVIAAPTNVHYELTKAALEADKHVVVDKPFVVTSREAKDLMALAKQKNKLLAVYQNRRWDGDFLTIQQLIKAGTFGKLNYFESHFDRYRPTVDPSRWREQAKPGSGLLYDLGAHLIDQALVLFGKPDWVKADIAKQRPNAVVDDYFHIIMAYDTLRVVLHTSSIVKAPGPRFTLHGDKGSFIKRGFDPQEVLLRKGKRPNDDPTWGEDDPKNYGTLTIDDNPQKIKPQSGDYREFYRQVYRSITQAEPFPVTSEQAIDLITLIESLK